MLNRSDDVVWADLDCALALRALVSSRGVRAILWPNSTLVSPDTRRDDEHPVARELRAQLAQYFAGARRVFDLPIAPEGTAFQLRAWRELARIPYGATLSYGEQAARLGDRKLARAVGGANRANPIPIVIPCHRVIGRSGALTGFAGGTKIKRALLDLEANFASIVTPPYVMG